MQGELQPGSGRVTPVASDVLQEGTGVSGNDWYNTVRCSLQSTYGRLAQGESTSLTRKGSEVQIL